MVHNRVEETRSWVTNGYLIGAHAAGAAVFENFCAGESRGFHLTEADLETFFSDVKTVAAVLRDEATLEQEPAAIAANG